MFNYIFIYYFALKKEKEKLDLTISNYDRSSLVLHHQISENKSFLWCILVKGYVCNSSGLLLVSIVTLIGVLK
jgi:hypothetical protein